LIVVYGKELKNIKLKFAIYDLYKAPL